MLSVENAPFVMPCDEVALADALRRFTMDADLRRVVGAANRVKVERKYDTATMFAAWGDLLASRSSLPAP